jgi:pimeloyl-ACP methyl ester carboxylesterase
MSPQTTTHYLTLSNTTIFYRTAGSPSKPTILLLHGFPTSSHMYRNLIPLLSQTHHVLAPDFPGFGFTRASADYEYTFANITATVGEFLDALGVAAFSMYIFDYGAPVGLRLALQRPRAVRALVSQNGNAYLDGLGDAWAPIKQYWKTGGVEDREVLRRGLLSFESVKWQYETGTPRPDRIAPESWTLDYALISPPANQEIQLDLFKDYETNVQLYPDFQDWFRSSQVPALVAWGKNDLLFIQPGAEAYKKDLPNAELHLLDAGHFAAETETQEIARLILEFLEKNGI